MSIAIYILFAIYVFSNNLFFALLMVSVLIIDAFKKIIDKHVLNVKITTYEKSIVRKHYSELVFLYRIANKGDELIDVTGENLNHDDFYTLTRLSITHDTYIASGFSTFVVKLRPNVS